MSCDSRHIIGTGPGPWSIGSDDPILCECARERIATLEADIAALTYELESDLSAARREIERLRGALERIRGPIEELALDPTGEYPCGCCYEFHKHADDCPAMIANEALAPAAGKEQ